MSTKNQNTFGAAGTLKSAEGELNIFRLQSLIDAGVGHVERLPISIKVLLESCLRNLDNFQVMEKDVQRLASWEAKAIPAEEVPFKPARVILQDFTGVPAVVDLAAMRSAIKTAGGDPQKINPLIPVDLVIDHSVQVDDFGNAGALMVNAKMEFERNRERYEFLKWGQKAFANFSVVPPATGIVHQVNLEYLASVVMVKEGTALPDSLVGTDSHTTMINGLGVVGWGVGGIEAEACMLGQPIYMLIPQVVGFKLSGQLPEGSTATDLVLVVTQMLRAHGVVDKFVEFYGDGLASMSVADRATIANMAPEYGATIGFFPVDDQTLRYMRLTGRDPKRIDLVERYCKEQGLWRQSGGTQPVFTETLELDLGKVHPSVAGPSRPQDRVELPQVKQSFRSAMQKSFKKEVAEPAMPRLERWNGQMPPAPARWKNLTDGDVVIAAITSCTNTSNPSVMVAAGLVAKKAVEKGLKVPPYVKTSLAPGSKVVTEYLNKSGLSTYLDKLGFQTVGYGCTTCIGNSGPLPEPISAAIDERNIVAAAVLSGNRNFEGRVHPQVKANYLASPPLVVAYALAGSVDVDLNTEPLGKGTDGKPVFLRDVWPTARQVQEVVEQSLSSDDFHKQYAHVADGNEEWNQVPIKGGELFNWDDDSTYIHQPPFFQGLSAKAKPIASIKGARVLVMVGDSVTTDHISPAGAIKKDSPAGKYLLGRGVTASDFNSYGSRRGDDRVMTRGTFANIRLKNLLAPGTEGGVTRHLPDGTPMSIYDASVKYIADGVPLIVLAGKDYGMGSSRDWAAKGVYLLGIKAAIAESFERIHRSNLVGMGVLPLEFKKGQTRATLCLTGEEVFEIVLSDDLKPKQDIVVKWTRPVPSKELEGVLVNEGEMSANQAKRVQKAVAATQSAAWETGQFVTTCRIDTLVEIEYFRNGGILHTVLRKMLW
jgi:aconitate hydratase